MRDLTRDSIVIHILCVAGSTAIGLLAHLAYQLVDLYFVSTLGAAAIAGLTAASSAMLIVNAVTHILGVATVTLMAHAVGRKDRSEANVLFNQSVGFAVTIGILTVGLLCALTPPYLRSVAAEPAVVEAGAQFMFWLMPGIALMFPMTAISSGLRGMGLVQATMYIYVLSVIVNALLAPILIVGWGTGVPLGVKGAGLATSLSMAVGLVLFVAYFRRVERYVALEPGLMRPQPAHWRRMLKVGLPAGGDFTLTFLATAVAYYAIRDLGTVVQAGFGIGSRILQAILLPALSIGFAAGLIAGQSFGAKDGQRIQQTFRTAAYLSSIAMLAILLLIQWQPAALLRVFQADPATLAVAASFLQIASWALIAQGMSYVCSSMFQAMGNTVPLLMTSMARFLSFAIPALVLALRPDLQAWQIWYALTASLFLQALISALLLRVEFRKRLPSAVQQRGKMPSAALAPK